eukprot:Em0868g2a
MLDNGIVEPSEGPWSSPIVLAKKKDGTLRFCVDYRKVNTITKRDAYPLPRIDDTLGTLGGSKFFTTMDLASGYWQVEMAPEDRPKTAFSTPEGLYQFRVMPFGLCNAPATFQRLMDRCWAPLSGQLFGIFDDIIVVGSSFGDHLRHIASVLMKLREAGLKLKPTKCKFFQKQVAFLGHIVSACGIATDPAKTEVIAKWPTPQSRKEVQQFLGPQGNGMVERFNRTLLDMLATAVGDNPADWENYIHKLCFAYNTSVHSSTGYSPFFLMFGRQAAIPVDLMYPLRREEEDKELPDFVQELKKRLQDAYASVRVHCQSEHLRQKAIYDRKAHGEQLKEGDLVWLFLPAVPRVERTKRAVVPQQTRVDANSRVSDEDLLLSDDDVEEGEHEDLPVDIPAGPAVGGAHGEQHPPPAAQEAPEAERRYPIRQRRAPDRYGPYIQH